MFPSFPILINLKGLYCISAASTRSPLLRSGGRVTDPTGNLYCTGDAPVREKLRKGKMKEGPAVEGLMVEGIMVEGSTVKGPMVSVPKYSLEAL
jgi:hypothetical protein